MGHLTHMPVTWTDLVPLPTTSGPGSAAPSFSVYTGVLRAYEYVGTGPTVKDFNYGFQFPHGWKEGSTVSPHLHLYIPDLLVGGNIRFYLDYNWANIGATGAESVSTIFGDLVRANNAGIAQNALLEFPNIVGTGKTLSSMLMTRLYRDAADAADTFEGSVWLKSIDVHYQQDAMGSNQEYSKW